MATKFYKPNQMSSFKAHAFDSEDDKKLRGVELGTNKL
jgi:hypothetical protein